MKNKSYKEIKYFLANDINIDNKTYAIKSPTLKTKKRMINRMTRRILKQVDKSQQEEVDYE